MTEPLVTEQAERALAETTEILKKQNVELQRRFDAAMSAIQRNHSHNGEPE